MAETAGVAGTCCEEDDCCAEADDAGWAGVAGVVSIGAALGALAAQIMLLAAIAALGHRSWLESLTVSLLGLLLVWASYVGGRQLVQSGLPVELALMFLGIALGGYAISYFFFRQTRGHFRVRLCHRDVTLLGAAGLRERSISIRSLMLLTTAIAIAVCTIKWTLPTDSQNLPSSVWLVVLQTLFFSLQSLAIFAAMIWIILGKSFSRRSTLLPIASMVFFPPVDAFLIQWLTREMIFDYLHMTYLYLIGLTTFSAINLGSLRFVGFQLLSHESKLDRS